MGVRHRRADLHLLVGGDPRFHRGHGPRPRPSGRCPRRVCHVRADPHQVRRGRGYRADPGAWGDDRRHVPPAGTAENDAAESPRIGPRRREDGAVSAMTAPREMGFLLAGPEKRVLTALAAYVPRTIRSNHLTVLGTIGSVVAGAGYALSNRHPAWLWLACLGLAINWLGDSLDGTLARVRQTQRPKYGYYLDHIVDAFSTTVIGLGIGLSPYVDVSIALGLVVAYLALSINVYLESTVFGVFRLAYGRIGPTVVLVGMIVVLVARFAHNIRRLAKLEPQRFRWWE